MLYEFLASDEGPLRLFNYLTFRTGLALVTAFLVTVIFGGWLIDVLRARQGKGQPIRDLSLEAQMAKQGTPTMGGLLIWIGLLLGTLLFADLGNPYIWVVLAVSISYAFLGFLDDYAKVTKQSTDGVSARIRLGTEFLVAALAGAFIMGLHGAHTPLGHADWGALNPIAEWIAAFAPETSVERNEASFSGGVAIPFVRLFPASRRFLRGLRLYRDCRFCKRGELYRWSRRSRNRPDHVYRRRVCADRLSDG